MHEANPLAGKFPGSEVIYIIKATNASGGGNAGGIKIDLQIPAGLTIKSAVVAYTGNAGGPVTITNTGSAIRPLFGDFNISPGDVVIITLTMQADCNIVPGKYNGSVQAIYLDPSRTFRDPKRRISGSVNAFTGTNTTYETGSAGPVPGSNYNGNLPGSVAEDITILPLTAISNNTISIAPPTAFCVNGDPSIINGSTPTGGGESYTYQWQSSLENITFTNIVTGSALKEFDPPADNKTTYYRRMVTSLSCTPSIVSNVITITVSHLPVAAFITPGICLKDGAALFTNQSTIDDGSEADLKYLWNFGDLTSPQNTSLLKNPLHAYSAAGNYTVTLSVTSGACSATVTKPFTLNGSIPKAGFKVSDNSTLCSSQPIAFEDKASVDFGEITRIEWYYDFANNPLLVQTDSNPGKRNAPPTLYPYNYPVFYSPVTRDVTVRMVVYSGLTCADEITIPIKLKAVPKAAFNSMEPVCNNINSFQVTQGGEVGGVLPGTGIYSGTGINAQGVFTPVVAGPGVHSLTYTYTAANGCSDFKTQSITVYEAPTVTGGKVEMLEGGQVQLPVITTGNNLTYKWTPPVSLNQDDIAQPLASPSKDINYTLQVTSAQGCSASNIVVVKVFQNPRIPNVFSPNSDGINDVWAIQNLNTYPDATIAIFNRYGQKIYNSIGYSIPWDGKYNGGDLPVGTYYYIIDTKKGRKPVSGSVTILR